VEDWGHLLGDTAAAGAILDRFLHHAEVIRLQGRSRRMYERQQRQRSAGTTSAAAAGPDLPAPPE
jgi:DNA replication protein DnaC